MTGPHRPAPVQVGDWCPRGGGHFLDRGDVDDKGCSGKAYPVYVWPENEDDAAMIRAALGAA